MDLTTMRARVREDVQDEDAANYRWTNDQVEGAIERAVREFSIVYPIQQQDDIATVESSRDLDISSLSGLIRVESVEFPIGQNPSYYQKFRIWQDTIQMSDEGDGGNARVKWYKEHTLGAAWQASTSYSLGAFVWPTSFNGYKYECTVAGISHATTEPTWPTTLGQTVTDGTVTWTCHSLETVVTYSTIPTQFEEIIVLGATGYLATSASVYTVDKATIAGKWATINFLKWGEQRLERYEKKLKALKSRVISREFYSDS